MDCKLLLRIIGSLGLVCLSSASFAIGELPGSAQPEQVSKALTPSLLPQQNALPPIKTRPRPEVSGLPEAAKKIKFKLNQIILVGNEVYSKRDLLPLYKDQLGKTISVADLYAIVQAITNYYRNNGYVLSRAILPPQHVKSGVVKIQIIEGYIGDVVVSGNPHRAVCQIYAFGCKIAEPRPLKLSHMEKYMLIANETPGTEVKAVLAPSATQKGAADLTLVTQNKTYSAFASYDNYGTRYIGPQQMTGNVTVYSFFASGDAASITFTKTPRGKELTYADGNYNVPLGASGLRWLYGGTYAHTHPLFVIQPQQVDGVNQNFYTSLQYPLIRTRSENLTIHAGFNIQDSNVQTFGNQLLYADHLRSLGAGFVYNFSDRFRGANLVSVEYRKGLPIWGYTQNTDPIFAKTSRPGGHADYSKFVLQMTRLQAIKGPFSLYAVFNGQYAYNPLLSAEQFTFGGSQLGRGYDVAELIGDKGVSGSFELRYDKPIGILYIQAVQLYAFYDYGVIWNYLNIGGIPQKDSGTSAGLGMRFYFTKYLSGNVMWAQPLTRFVLTETQQKQVVIDGLLFNVGNGHRPRVFFSLVLSTP